MDTNPYHRISSFFNTRVIGYLQLYTSLSNHCQQQKANANPEDLFVTDCLSSTDERKWKQRKQYRTDKKDNPYIYSETGLFSKNGINDAKALIISSLHKKLKDKSYVHYQDGWLNITYKIGAVHTFSWLHFSEKQFKRLINELVEDSIIIKREKSVDRRRKLGVRDNRLDFTLNYDRLAKIRISPEYLDRCAKFDKESCAKIPTIFL